MGSLSRRSTILVSGVSFAMGARPWPGFAKQRALPLVLPLPLPMPMPIKQKEEEEEGEAVFICDCHK